MWLALPMALLLFAQWPLRDVLARFSREANDAGQVLFALYVAVALTSATRRGAHVAADVISARYSGRARDIIERTAALAVLAPWACFMLFAAWRPSLASVLQLEGFPETFNPGYFLLRIALLLLAVLVLAQAIVTAARPRSPPMMPIAGVCDARRPRGGVARDRTAFVDRVDRRRARVRRRRRRRRRVSRHPARGDARARLLGLLENDLLQALPLYALMGALLVRLPLAAIAVSRPRARVPRHARRTAARGARPWRVAWRR